MDRQDSFLCVSNTHAEAEAAPGSPAQMNESAGTPKNAASFFAWALLIDRFPFTISEARPLDPSSGAIAACLWPRFSSKARSYSPGAARGTG